jgi:hypothetical protein
LTAAGAIIAEASSADALLASRDAGIRWEEEPEANMIGGADGAVGCIRPAGAARSVSRLRGVLSHAS